MSEQRLDLQPTTRERRFAGDHRSAITKEVREAIVAECVRRGVMSANEAALMRLRSESESEYGVREYDASQITLDKLLDLSPLTSLETITPTDIAKFVADLVPRAVDRSIPDGVDFSTLPADEFDAILKRVVPGHGFEESRDARNSDLGGTFH